MVLIAHPAFPPKTTADVLAFIKANPGKVSCGASGALPSVGCELRAQAGADMLMVMYKGNAPASRVSWAARSTCSSTSSTSPWAM